MVTRKQIKEYNEQNWLAEWGHLTYSKQRTIKVLIILKNIAWAGMVFSAGVIFAYIKIFSNGGCP